MDDGQSIDNFQCVYFVSRKELVMFYIENEEEYVRAIRVLEAMYQSHEEATPEMRELKQAIEDWEAANS